MMQLIKDWWSTVGFRGSDEYDAMSRAALENNNAFRVRAPGVQGYDKEQQELFKEGLKKYRTFINAVTDRKWKIVHSEWLYTFEMNLESGRLRNERYNIKITKDPLKGDTN